MVQLAARLNKTVSGPGGTMGFIGHHCRRVRSEEEMITGLGVGCRKILLFPIWLRNREFGQVFILNCSEWGCLASNKFPCACPSVFLKQLPTYQIPLGSGRVMRHSSLYTYRRGTRPRNEVEENNQIRKLHNGVRKIKDDYPSIFGAKSNPLST
jgi:hypothetical protein